jgi:hypothetical protein
MASREDFEGGFGRKVRKVQIVVEVEIESDTAGEARQIASRAFLALFSDSNSNYDQTLSHDQIVAGFKAKPDFSTMKVVE